MDERVRRAMARWPDVPALYGWLRLDEAGRWWLRDVQIRNQALFDFIGRNYAVDARGCWYFQNGPQRGYATLDYTPWVLHLDDSDGLRTQHGDPVPLTGPAVLDDEANLILTTDRGPGLVSGEALARLCDALVDAEDQPLTLDALEHISAGGEPGGSALRWQGQRVALIAMPRATVPRHFGYNPAPSP